MKRPDYFLVLSVIVLLLFGVLVLSSVSAAISQEKFGSPNTYFFHHIIFGLLPGILLGFVAYKIPLSIFKRSAPFLLLGSLITMILVFIPKIGITLGGSSSWLNLGIVSVQPSEFLKLAFILYSASWLAGRIERGVDRKKLLTTFVPFFVIMAVIVALLALQPDYGTLSIIIATALLMYFLSGTPIWHSIMIGIAILGGLAAAIKYVPYRMSRFTSFINPDFDPMGQGWQIKQSLIAIGSGGILGTGLGMSVQRFGYLPQTMGDSIFASLCEETGFVGALTMVIVFLIFIWTGFSIAKNTKQNFYRLTALGIIGWLTIQTFVNIGSMLGLLPLTGVPLPFISYGGSAIVAELIGVGILLNISKHTKS